MAVNIAERSRKLSTTTFELPTKIHDMALTTRSMMREALNALVALDSIAALRVCQRDDEVDRLHAEITTEIYILMRDDSSQIAPSIHCLSIARHIERVADLATNVAEDVVYLVRGDIARHRHIEIPPSSTTS